MMIYTHTNSPCSIYQADSRFPKTIILFFFSYHISYKWIFSSKVGLTIANPPNEIFTVSDSLPKLIFEEY